MSDARERVAGMEYCTNCGSALEPDAKFCTNCGAAVETSSNDTNAAEQPAQAMPVQPSWSTPTQPVPQNTAPRNTMPQQGAPSPTMPTTNAMPPNGSPVPPVQPPMDQPPVPGQPPVQTGDGTPKPKGKPNIPVIVAAAVLVVALLGVGIAYGVLGSGKTKEASPAATSSVASPKTQPSASSSAKAGVSLNADKLQSIVSGYSETEAAVSVVPVGENDEFDSRQANTKFVAAGLYLPVYLAAKDSGNSGAVSSAETMMRTMDNDSGNAAVSDLGGLSALNGWLGGAGYSNTDFQRAFGDVEASNSGYENYTSAADAAKMLAATATDGGTNLLSYDLASEGVTTPSGVTLNGHRGQGIKNSYNFFILMKTGKTTMAVSVLTQNLGKDTAVSLTNDILAEVAAEVQ
ncbi:zinc-ribbon domain-containing protein [Bifidobacterium callimiconis]|nr:zinc-ribbon domain-containing protein [Bifidobacterium callimiconis]